MVEYIEYEEKFRSQVIDFWINICVKEFGFKEWKYNIENMDNDTYKQNNGNFWIAVEDGKVIGTISLKNIGDNEAFLKGMYVQKEYRRKGISSNLMNILLDFAKKRGYQKIVLETYKKFDRAINFYERLGFAKIEEIGDRYIYQKEVN